MAQRTEETPRIGALIGGERVFTGEFIETLNPSTGEALAEVAACTAAEVDGAVRAAQTAFDGGWGRTSAAERARTLNTLAAAIRAHADELAELESLDTGKPLRQGRLDAEFSARYYEYYANMVEAVFGNVIPAATDRLTLSIREPIGVTGHIIPWNYPMGLGSRTIAPTLAAGNCAVLKPAEAAPLTSLRLAEIFEEAGLPAGVLNVVTGSGVEAGAALAAHRGIGKISFTGSVPVGVRIAQAAAQNLVPAELELGGKSPNIVFADADLDAAAEVVAAAILQNAGQTCSAGSRLLVQEGVHDEFVRRLVGIFERTTIGAGIDDPGLGPVITAAQQRRVLDYLRLGAEEATVLTGGGIPDDERLAGGFFVQPTVFDGVDPSSRIAQEEIFGPVLAVTSFATTEEAIEIANGTAYGLVSAVWTSNVGRAHRMIRDLRSGQVMVNTFSNGVELPFSGRKDSGYGVSKGVEGLLGYTKTKGAVIMMSDA